MWKYFDYVYPFYDYYDDIVWSVGVCYHGTDPSFHPLTSLTTRFCLTTYTHFMITSTILCGVLVFVTMVQTLSFVFSYLCTLDYTLSYLDTCSLPLDLLSPSNVPSSLLFSSDQWYHHLSGLIYCQLFLCAL